VKLLLSTIAAISVSLLLFYFMRILLNTDNQDSNQLKIAAVVELYQATPKIQEPLPKPQQEFPEEVVEPDMEGAMPIIDSTPSPSVKDIMSDFEIGNLTVLSGGSDASWSLPIDADLVDTFNSKDNQGVYEVVPFATRAPNIPKIAWQNKLNGWVLVAFNIGAKGNAENVRLLDSNPKGIFEKEVILALEGWRYDVSKIKNYQGDMVLTQKIHLYWKDYPNNEKLR